jgi:hypothetical protein
MYAINDNLVFNLPIVKNGQCVANVSVSVPLDITTRCGAPVLKVLHDITMLNLTRLRVNDRSAMVQLALMVRDPYYEPSPELADRLVEYGFVLEVAPGLCYMVDSVRQIIVDHTSIVRMPAHP